MIVVDKSVTPIAEKVFLGDSFEKLATIAKLVHTIVAKIAVD